METVVLTLTFHRDTLELDINGPGLSPDFCMSLLDRAKHLLETHEKLAMAQQVRVMGDAVRIRLP